MGSEVPFSIHSLHPKETEPIGKAAEVPARSVLILGSCVHMGAEVGLGRLPRVNLFVLEYGTGVCSNLGEDGYRSHVFYFLCSDALTWSQG